MGSPRGAIIAILPAAETSLKCQIKRSNQMINHFYTLAGVVHSLKRLIGCKLVECFSQDKDEIIFAFLDGNNDLHHLCINLTTKNYCINLRDRFRRANSNTRDLFGQILGETLQDVFIAENNRIITLQFIVLTAVVELFGPGKNRLLFLNSKGKIYDDYSGDQNLIGEKYEYPPCNMKKPDAENFATVGELLTKSTILLPKIYAGELLKMHSLQFDTPTGEVSKLDDIISDAFLMRQDALHTQKFYLYTDENGALLTHLPIKSLGEYREFDDINKAVSVRYSFSCRLLELDSQKKTALKKLQLLRKRAAANLKMCQNAGDLAPKIDEYTLYADLLLSQPRTTKKFGEQITLNDWEGNPLNIPLKPELTLPDNAARYYKKAKTIKTDIELKRKMLPAAESKFEKTENLIDTLNAIDNLKDLKNFMAENFTNKGNNTMKELDESPESKFRRFEIGEDYCLYVGKNATNNDELTVKFAKPNDFWFHARGCAGSHAVLRCTNTKLTRPPKDILKTVAGIVAYYSKQKNAGMVPVAWTQKKYVYKPRNAAVGEVVMKREEVFMAEPKLPVETE